MLSFHCCLHINCIPQFVFELWVKATKNQLLIAEKEPGVSGSFRLCQLMWKQSNKSDVE
jgi:hypothetical protein